MRRGGNPRITISADADGVGRATKQAEGHLDRLGRSAGRSLGGLSSSMATVAKTSALALGVGLAVETKRAVAAYEEARKIGAQSNAVIKSTGGVAKISAKEVGELAEQLARKTGVDDELIQSGENVLLTFKGIRDEAGKGNDIFTQATRATLDMSVALGKDMQGSAIQVGKALNDPIKGVTALGRAGVQFTDQQKEQIKTLVESGNKLDAQKIILRELETQFGGSAAAQASAMDKAKVSIGNVEEAIGHGLAPAVNAVAGEIDELAQDAAPELEAAAKAIEGIFGRKDLNLGEKLVISGRTLERKLGPLLDDVKGAIENAHLGEKFAEVVEDAAPLIADSAARAAPRAAVAFVSAFQNAGPWGKLITVAFLAQKLGAFNAVGSLAADRFTGSMKKRMASSAAVKSAGTAAGATLGGAVATQAGTSFAAQGPGAIGKATKSGKFSRGMSLAGAVVGRVFVAAMVAEILLGLKDVPAINQYFGAQGREEFLDDVTDIFQRGPDHEEREAAERARARERARERNRNPVRDPRPGDAPRLGNRPPGPREKPRRGPRASGATARVSARARASDIAPPLAQHLSSAFGLTFTDGWRPQNAGYGAKDSWHKRGTPARPGAIDLVGSMSAMQDALEWARENVDGLAEAMIHDAGSGLHLHLAGPGVMNWTGTGRTTGSRIAPTPRRAPRQRPASGRGRQVGPNTTAGRGDLGGGRGQGGPVPTEPGFAPSYEQSLADIGLAKAQAGDSTAKLIPVLVKERRLKRRRLRRVRRLLKRKLLPETRTRLTEEGTQLVTDLAEIRALLKEYRADKDGIVGADDDTAGGGVDAVEPPTAADFISSDIARATLTPGLDDDLTAAQAWEHDRWLHMQDALGNTDPRDDAAAVAEYAEANGHLQEILKAIQGGNELQAQRDAINGEIAANQRRLIHLAETQGPQLLAAVIAAVDGGIGGPLGLALQSAGTPGLVGRA